MPGYGHLLFIGALLLGGLALLGGSFALGYSKGYELAELRGQKELQALKDEIIKANAAIRAENARKQAEMDKLKEARVAEVLRHAEQEREDNEKLAEYATKLAQAIGDRPDPCGLGPDDINRVR